MDSLLVPVAQWIERWVADPKVRGSSPLGDARRVHLIMRWAFCFPLLVHALFVNYCADAGLNCPEWITCGKISGRIKK